MITEMELGFSGHCPYTNLGRCVRGGFRSVAQREETRGFDMFGRIQAFDSITPISSIDIMIARGVFKPGTKARAGAARAGAEGRGGRGRVGHQLSIEEIRTELDTYLKPYLRA